MNATVHGCTQGIHLSAVHRLDELIDGLKSTEARTVDIPNIRDSEALLVLYSGRPSHGFIVTGGSRDMLKVVDLP